MATNEDSDGIDPSISLGHRLVDPDVWKRALAVCQRAASTNSIMATPDLAVGPQYDATHVYVTPEDFDRFVSSVVATFGGTTNTLKKAESAGVQILVSPY